MSERGHESETPIIDVHSHFIPEPYWEAIQTRIAADPAFADLATRNNLVPQPEGGPMRDVRVRIKDMDDAGVAISVLSLPPPGVVISPGDAALAKKVNDALVDAAALEPRRFRAMCVLPLPDVEASLAELDRALAHPLIRGVALTTDSQHWRLDDEELLPIYRRLADADRPLFVHPALEPLPAVYAEYALTASVAAVVSSSLGVLRMIYSGMLDREPRLTVIMPHLGGVIPYLAQRLSDLGGRQLSAQPLSHYLERRLLFDTCSYHPPAFRCAVDTVGASRLVLGTDYPFRGSIRRAVDDVRANELDPAAERGVLGATVSHWFA